MGTVNGSNFLYTKNVNAKGLLLLFHGGGGSMEDNLYHLLIMSQERVSGSMKNKITATELVEERANLNFD